jgi:hypothetical protein
MMMKTLRTEKKTAHKALTGICVALKTQRDLHTGLWLAADLLAGAGPVPW